jgi:hypothetical protein
VELLLVAAMIGAGIAIAAVVLFVAVLYRRREEERAERFSPGRDPAETARTILVEVARRGGLSAAEAEAVVREAGYGAGAGREGIDLTEWAASYRRATAPADARALLDAAVHVAVRSAPVVAIGQWSALLDVCFALGFHTDALAALRAKYRFRYVDGSHGRPPEAWRRGRSGRPAANAREVVVHLERFGLAGPVGRRELASAYRKRAAECHPDRYHSSSPETREAAALRFIELTEAYEALLPLCRGD